MNPTPTVSIRSSKWGQWGKPAIIAAGAILVVLLALLALPRLININTYRGQIVGQLEQALGRPVKLGEMSLRVLPSIQVKVEEVRIGDDPKFAQADFVQARAVRLRLGLMSLLRGNPQVSGLELDEPVIVLIKDPANNWNWGTLKPLQSTEKESSQPPFDLRVRDGRFTMIDRTVQPAVERKYTGVNATLGGFAARKAFDLALELIMPGEKSGALSIEGEAGPIDNADAMLTPVDARVRMTDVDLVALESLIGTSSPRRGRLTMDVKLKGRLAEGMKANGQIKAEQLRLVDNVEPARTPLETDFSLTAKSAKKGAETEFSVNFDQCQLRMGKTKADIAGRIDRLPASPALDLQLKGDNVALDTLLESAYAFGFGPPPGTKAGGTASIDLRATGDAQAMALNGKAEFRELKFQNSSMPQPVTVSELKLTANPNEITAAPFRTTLSRTTVELNNLKISNYAKQPRAHLDLATNNAQLDDLLKIAESFGVRPGMSASGGTASLKAAVDANLGGENLAMNLSGSGKLAGTRLQMTGAAKPIEVGNADLAFTGDSLRIDNLAAQAASSQVNGWLSVKDFDHPQASFDLKANQLNVAEIQQAIGGGSAKAAPAKSSAGASLRAEGNVFIGKLILDSITATDVQSKVTMVNQIITLNPLSLKLYGGAYQGSARLDQSNAQAPEFALAGTFNGLDINQFLSNAGAKSSIYGRANGTVDLRGRNEASSDATAKSLAGKGSIAINDGKFASFDLMKQVEVLGRLVNLPTGGAGTAFRSLKTNLTFDRGRMRTDQLQIVMDDLQVNGDGAIQLGDAPTMDYSILAKMSPGLTKRVLPSSGSQSSGQPASGLGKLLPGAEKLTGGVGSFFVDRDAMVIPLRVSGPMKQPSFGLNSAILQQRAKEKFTERLVEGLTPKDANKDAGKDATQKDAAKEPAKPKPADLLKGVLEGLGKKKKPEN